MPTPRINSAAYWDMVWEREHTQDASLVARDYRDKWTAICRIAQGLGSVLDCGCGPGHLLAKLKAAGCPATGLDHSEQAVEICRQRGLQAEVADLLAEDESVASVVVASEVVEHFDDVRAVIQALRGRARKLLVLAVPNGILGPGVEPEHWHVFDTAGLATTLGSPSEIVAIEDWWLPCLVAIVPMEELEHPAWEAARARARTCHTVRARPWTDSESYVRFQLARRLQAVQWSLPPIEAGRWLSHICDLTLERSPHLRDLITSLDPVQFRSAMDQATWAMWLDHAAHQASAATANRIRRS